MDQIIDIATEGRHLSRDRGFLKVSDDGVEIGRTPLDRIAGVIVHAHGTTWSTSLLTELAERGAPVVLCAANHSPKSVLMPLEGHYAQGARMRAQWQAKAPFIKQAWKQIVISKVLMQAAALDAIGEAAAALQMMARKVTSGDSTNIEAQAARHYWPRIMGPQFRRDTRQGDENACSTMVTPFYALRQHELSLPPGCIRRSVCFILTAPTPSRWPMILWSRSAL